MKKESLSCMYRVAFILVIVCAGTLLTYGQDAGDMRLQRLDDYSSNITFFNQTFITVYINTNGGVSFVKGVTSFLPKPFPLPSGVPITAPNWADADTSRTINKKVVSGIDITSAFVGSNRDVFDSSSPINMGTLMETDIADNYPVESKLQASGVTTTSGITPAAGTTSTAPPPASGVTTTSGITTAAGTTSTAPPSANSLRIAAFNVQVFGREKASKPHVMDIIVKIVHRYEIIFFQEIRDTTFSVLLQLNDRIQTTGKSYTYVNSTRLGRTATKEQYAYFYRTNIGLTLQETYQEPDPTDLFERPPYAARFLYKPTGSTDQVEFFLVGIHTKPNDTFAEINGLDEVRGNLSSTHKWGLTKSIILGDLNADCSYLNKTVINDLDLRKDDSIWLIDDGVNTTVAKSSCAYDRFIATPDVMANVQPMSCGVFRFDKEYKLKKKTTKAVSDHYPIELVLVPKG